MGDGSLGEVQIRGKCRGGYFLWRAPRFMTSLSVLLFPSFLAFLSFLGAM